jgi:hypothetical protein
MGISGVFEGHPVDNLHWPRLMRSHAPRQVAPRAFGQAFVATHDCEPSPEDAGEGNRLVPFRRGDAVVVVRRRPTPVSNRAVPVASACTRDRV